jgi:hypothetical protein
MFSEWASSYFKLFIVIVILVSGTVLNTMLTKRVALIVGFMGAFFIQAFIRHWLFGVQLNTALSVMTGIAFVLFTNYMITDPGTTPSRPRAQFIFGSSVAFVYALLMGFNIVYGLFFATAIVCACRGMGWWAAYLIKRRRSAGAGPTSATMVDPGAVTEAPASNGAGGKAVAGETVTA